MKYQTMGRNLQPPHTREGKCREKKHGMTKKTKMERDQKSITVRLFADGTRSNKQNSNNKRQLGMVILQI